MMIGSAIRNFIAKLFCYFENVLFCGSIIVFCVWLRIDCFFILLFDYTLSILWMELSAVFISTFYFINIKKMYQFMG